jgi:hypothetical protein
MPRHLTDRPTQQPSQRLLDTVVERHPMVTDGKSGALLERVRLADGQALIVKHIDGGRDWIMQATGDPGRMGRLWSGGVFDVVPAVIDHAIVAVEPDGAGGWRVGMADVSEALFPRRRRLSRAEGRRLLAAAAELHGAFRGRPRPGGLAPLAELYRFLPPRSLGASRRRRRCPAMPSGAGRPSPSWPQPTWPPRSRESTSGPKPWPRRSPAGPARWCTAT